MSQPFIPYTTISTRQLLDTHNQLAQQRGLSPLPYWKDTRVKLVQRVALMRTHRPAAAKISMKAAEGRKRAAKKKPPRETPVRDAILKGLALVSHYEHVETGKVISKRSASRYPRKSLLSVGLPYAEVLAWLRKKMPDATSSEGVLRWTATQVRNGVAGFGPCVLPQKRPHGTNKRSTTCDHLTNSKKPAKPGASRATFTKRRSRKAAVSKRRTKSARKK